MPAVITRISRIALLSLLAFASTSCVVVSKSTLIDFRSAKSDYRLKGRWVGTDKLSDVYAQFDGSSTLDTNIISGKDGGKPSERMFEYAGGTIGKYEYLSLRPQDEATGGYLLVRYVIEGDVMKVWLLDSYSIDSAVSQGKLKGEKSGGSTTTLTDSPKKIAAFIAANEGSAELFELLGVFKKSSN
ncbi:MAG TPA: hypothetical protein VJU86_04910 [Pyrinomonadaceae bacterium]|nr:hypothetical protein [Pyrinomonadaceae bacterium]